MDPVSIAIAVFTLIASSILTASMMPKAKPPEPAAFESFQFPQAEEGTPQCVIFGDCWSEDWMVVAYGDYRTREIRV